MLVDQHPDYLRTETPMRASLSDTLTVTMKPHPSDVDTDQGERRNIAT